MNLADLKKTIIKSKPTECTCQESGEGGADFANDNDEEKKFAEVVEMVSLICDRTRSYNFYIHNALYDLVIIHSYSFAN